MNESEELLKVAAESTMEYLGEYCIEDISSEVETVTSGCAGAPVQIRTDQLRWMVWATLQLPKWIKAYRAVVAQRDEALAACAAYREVMTFSSCHRCEGEGLLWADGKPHYATHQGDTKACPDCDGKGQFLDEIAIKKTLASTAGTEFLRRLESAENKGIKETNDMQTCHRCEDTPGVNNFINTCHACYMKESHRGDMWQNRAEAAEKSEQDLRKRVEELEG